MLHTKTLVALSIVAALLFLTGVQVFSYAQSNESASQNREQAKQTEGTEEQAKTSAEEQALAGTPEVTNMTNATMANATSAGNMTGNISG
jgi:type II secretory pathway pseudopilin PulG